MKSKLGFAVNKTVSNVRKFKHISEDKMKQLKQNRLKKELLPKFNRLLELIVIGITMYYQTPLLMIIEFMSQIYRTFKS